MIPPRPRAAAGPPPVRFASRTSNRGGSRQKVETRTGQAKRSEPARPFCEAGTGRPGVTACGGWMEGASCLSNLSRWIFLSSCACRPPRPGSIPRRAGRCLFLPRSVCRRPCNVSRLMPWLIFSFRQRGCASARLSAPLELRIQSCSIGRRILRCQEQARQPIDAVAFAVARR